jgi:hypothetical protein
MFADELFNFIGSSNINASRGISFFNLPCLLCNIYSERVVTIYSTTFLGRQPPLEELL